VSEAPKEAPKQKKYESYNPETYKTDEEKKEEVCCVTIRLQVVKETLLFIIFNLDGTSAYVIRESSTRNHIENWVFNVRDFAAFVGNVEETGFGQTARARRDGRCGRRWMGESQMHEPSCVRRKISRERFHSVMYSGQLFVVCGLCDVTIWRHIHVSKPTFWRSLLT